MLRIHWRWPCLSSKSWRDEIFIALGVNPGLGESQNVLPPLLKEKACPVSLPNPGGMKYL